MLKITVVPRIEDLSIFRNRGAQIIASVVAGVNRSLIGLQSYIIRNKLSGSPLHRRSGTLAGSVTVVPAEAQGSKIAGAVESSAGPAHYGWVHEFGGSGGSYEIVPTRARVLRFVKDGQTIFRRHVDHPALPERSFMRSSLDEQREVIIAQIQRALDDGLKG